MNLAAALLLGHLLADFPLQTTWIYQYKTKSWKGILIHTAIHVLVTACLVKPLLQALPLLILLGILHFLTDYTKVRIPARQQSPGFLIDQFLHIVAIFMLARLWQGTLAATLSPFMLTVLISYGFFLGIMIFLWVLACDLAKTDWGKHAAVQWTQTHLLQLSSYAGLALLIFLAQLWGRTIPRAR
ncbi:MAG: DUF3307 domain-containing protein [Caldilineaceae bacterium]|nr:DUF3307 domain-containing protein [Caldilineaceae bacterium]